MRARIIPIRVVLLVCLMFAARLGSAQCRSDNVNLGITDPINPNIEFNEYAAISVDARDANCKDTASAKLAAKLSATLGYVQSTSCPPHMVRDNQIGACATPFKTWLAGDMVTHIFRAALALESWQIFVSPNLIQQVENDFAGNAPGNVAMPQDPYCGSQSMPGGVNSCMDDFALTATGFGWIAAWENRKNAGGGSPGSYISAAQSAITQAFSPMTQNGGGPCYYVVGSNPIQCNGDFAGNPNCPGPNCPVRIMGANHDIENPAYGLGLMTSIASACVGLYIAGAPCDLSGQAQIATELMKSAQDRLTQGDNSHFASTSRPDAAGQACLDFKTVTLTADCADVYDYHPTDMPMQRFYDKKGLPRPNPDLYQFDRDDPGLASHYPNNGCMDFYGCNRQEFYDELTWNLWGPDTTAPVVTWTSPQDGAVLSGIVTLAVNATDNLKVSSVEIYANGSRLTPTYNDCSQIPGATAILNPPYRLCVDTSNGSVDGTYTLTAKAYDEAGNVGNSAPITITVSNPGCLHPPTGLRYEGFPSRNILWNPPDNATGADQVHYDLWLFGPSCPNGCEIAPGAPSWYTIGPSTQGGTYTWRLQAISNSRCYSGPVDGPSFVLTQLDLYINRTTFQTTDTDWTITMNSTLVGSSVTLIEEFWNGSQWQEDWRGGIGQISSSGVLTFVGGAPYFAGSFRSHVEAAGSSSGYVYYSVTL